MLPAQRRLLHGFERARQHLLQPVEDCEGVLEVLGLQSKLCRVRSCYAHCHAKQVIGFSLPVSAELHIVSTILKAVVPVDVPFTCCFGELPFSTQVLHAKQVLEELAPKRLIELRREGELAWGTFLYDIQEPAHEATTESVLGDARLHPVNGAATEEA